MLVVREYVFALTRSGEAVKGVRVRRQVLVLEHLVRMVYKNVEVISTKMGVTSGSLGLKKTLLDSQERDI
jgi:hypothetical protein